MATQIQLGNLFSVNGRQVLGGSASGIDIESLVEGLTQAKLVPADKLQDRIDVNTNKGTALSELRKILNNFRDASNFLRNPPGVGNEADNIFSYRSAALSSNTSVAASAYLSVTVQPGADQQNYTIDNITQIAQAKKQESNIFAIANQDTQVVFAAPGADQFGAGTITINGHSITLDDGDTLRTVAKKFNDVASLTGIGAQVFQVSPGNFKLIYTATQTGTTADFDLGGPPTVNADPFGVFTNVAFNNIQLAQNASFDIDGVTITRETNSISDLVDGVTFNLLSDTNAAPATQLGVQVKADTQIVKNGVLNFVNAYNDFKLFVSKQQQVGTNGLPTEDAVLFSDTTMRSALSSVSSELSRVVAGITGGDPSRLSEIGVTFSTFPGDTENPFTRNILTVDDAKLQSAIESDFDAVRKVFEFDFNSNSSKLQVFSRSNSINVNSFQLNVDQTNGVYQATYDPGTGPVTIDVDATAISGGGLTIKGQAGTVLEGLTLIYSDGTDDVIDVEMTQGIGDRMFNLLDTVLDEEIGSLQSSEQSLVDSNERFLKEINRINEQVEKFREELIRKFSDLEAAITKVNNLLLVLDAQAQAQAASN